MKLLAIDVCSGACSVALALEGQTAAARHEPMTRGHAERLAPMVTEVLAEGGLAALDLDGIAVTTGPGSFTGARLGVSFARGLALATGAPATGLSVFEVMAARAAGAGCLMIALPGKKGSLLLQRFDGASPHAPAAEYSAEDAARVVPSEEGFTIIGAASADLISALPDTLRRRAMQQPAPPITAKDVASAALPLFQRQNLTPPAPLYLRAPDAKPQAVVALTP